MKYLVTGAAGYIGSLLCQKLVRAGHEVIAVDNLRYANAPPILSLLDNSSFEFHKLNVLDQEFTNLIPRADTIVHLAALVGAPVCEAEPDEAWWVNCLSVHSLIAELSHSQRLIYPNTNSGYGINSQGRDLTEEDPLNPISVYGQSKCKGEWWALEHSNTVVLRLATVFGRSLRPRFDLMVNDFVEKLHRTKSLCVYEPEFNRNFIGITDVVRAIRFFCETKPELTGVYNVGHPAANISKLKLAETICDVLRLNTSCITRGDGEDPDKRNYQVSNAKLIAAGFMPRQSLEEGILDVVQLVDLLTPEQTRCMRNT